MRTARRLLTLAAALLTVATVGIGSATADPVEPPWVMNLVNTNSGLCLTATDQGYNYAVLQMPCNGGPAQQWQSSGTSRYLRDMQWGRCASALPGTSQLRMVDCRWDYGEATDRQRWDFAGPGGPTTFPNHANGWCLGILPGNSWARVLDCNSGSTVTWYR